MRRLLCKGILPLLCLPGLFLCCFSCATTPDMGAGRSTVAVWDLEDVSPVSSRVDVGELLSAEVSGALQRKGEYTIVERTRLVRVLEELHLGSSELADDETRLRVGRLLGARYMVFGGYQIVGSQLRLDLRLVEVETGKIRKAVSRIAPSTGGMSGWLEAAGKAGAEL
jgi:curli biogenesis system outer membrane secretion channel CsgG